MAPSKHAATCASPPPSPTLTLAVIAETPDWIAIHKPAGISMHTEHNEPGIVVLASQQLDRPLLPVHRLDKVTSGVLLLAKHSQAAAELGRLFEQHSMQKYYLAQSTSKPLKKQGWIKGDMAKGRNGSWLLTRSMTNPAITRFVSHYDASSHKRLFLLAPKTGKTHQLRVAMKSLGSAVEGDSRYKGSPSDRTYLHALGLVFEHQGQRHEIMTLPDSGDWRCSPELWLTAPWRVIS